MTETSQEQKPLIFPPPVSTTLLSHQTTVAMPAPIRPLPLLNPFFGAWPSHPFLPLGSPHSVFPHFLATPPLLPHNFSFLGPTLETSQSSKKSFKPSPFSFQEISNISERSRKQSREYVCPHCKRTFNSAGGFHTHLKTHMQGCECPICGKSFSRHWLLQGHIRTHTGEKPFKCPVCRKAFADKSNLRAHIQTHSGVKPFLCRNCGKSFALKSYLTKHEESSCARATGRII